MEEKSLGMFVNKNAILIGDKPFKLGIMQYFLSGGLVNFWNDRWLNQVFLEAVW